MKHSLFLIKKIFYSILYNYEEDEKFKNFNIIHVKWIFYDDNNLIFYDNCPTQQRFIRPRHLIDKNFTTPKGKYTYRVCDVTKIKNKFFLKENPAELFNLTVPYLNILVLKLLKNILKKMNRGFPLSGTKIFEKVISKDFFLIIMIGIFR